MKDFIVNSGKVIIDVAAWVVLFALIIFDFGLLVVQPLAALIIVPVEFIIFVSLFYVIYLFIDTNETLHKILDKHNEKNNN